MRRWFAVLLLVLLPIQLSWAAVASYCAHETESAAGHFGHHDHAGHGHASPADSAGQDAQADGTATGLSDLDCGHCHGYCAGILAAVNGFAAQAADSAPPALGPAPGAEPMPAQPERPQWAPLA